MSCFKLGVRHGANGIVVLTPGGFNEVVILVRDTRTLNHPKKPIPAILAFCDSVKPLLPAQTAGEKGLIDTIVGGTVGPLIDAVKAIWLRIRDDNALMRKTIETQLEATTWRDFGSVPPAS